MSELTDEAIAIRVQHGDDQSFGILMRRYEHKLTRFGSRFLSSHEDIQDMLQEIFVKAFVNLQSFDANQKFSAWIYRIAHNQFVDQLKKKSREKISFFDLDAFFPHLVGTETADPETNREDLKGTLDQCLDKLDAKYREPLILYYFEELDYQEIAEILQIPISKVGVRLQRGKSLMKKLIEQHGETYG
ncbi:MAG: RNA polymerase sigma factor [Chloroflexi bacterium]|nr:RNA polymerase sigma factor [Chloroflexota bacterium]